MAMVESLNKRNKALLTISPLVLTGNTDDTMSHLNEHYGNHDEPAEGYDTKKMDV